MPAVSTSDDRQPADVRALGQQIARRPGNSRDDRAVGVEQRVEQARLADVRRADDRHRAPSRIRRPRAACAQQRVDRAITPRSIVALPRLDEVIALVWKIERRLELGDQIEQLRFDRAIAVVSVPSS